MKNEEHTLGFLIGRASHTMITYLNKILRKEGIDLPHSQYILLKVLYFKDNVSQKELADMVYKDTSAIKRTLDILEKKKLIERVPVTLRKNNIVILKAGRELIPEVFACMDRHKEPMLAGISNDEYELFTDVLERIRLNIV